MARKGRVLFEVLFLNVFTKSINRTCDLLLEFQQCTSLTELQELDLGRAILYCYKPDLYNKTRCNYIL
jgi:hypothetical protein